MNELLLELIKRFGAEGPEGNPNPIPKLLGSDGFVPEDEPYLRQFLGGGELIPTSLRPSRLKVDDNLSWYRPTFNPVKTLLENDRLAGAKPIDTSKIDAMKPGDVLQAWAPPAPGLGHFTASIGKEQSGQPFLSVYDKWDFESPVIKPIISKMMGAVGKPFHVYERYPLNKVYDLQPTNLTKIQKPSIFYTTGRDIELPADK